MPLIQLGNKNSKEQIKNLKKLMHFHFNYLQSPNIQTSFPFNKSLLTPVEFHV